MWRCFCRSKIHRAKVTETNLNYEGSLTLDPLLMEAAGLLPFERVSVLNLHSGARFDTYIIEGQRGSGTVCVNGAAARLVQPGDLLIILAYAWVEEREMSRFRPKVVHVDEANRVQEVVESSVLPRAEEG